MQDFFVHLVSVALQNMRTALTQADLRRQSCLVLIQFVYKFTLEVGSPFYLYVAIAMTILEVLYPKKFVSKLTFDQASPETVREDH